MLQTAPKANAYDTVPYPKYPHRSTHPRHLETLASLFGMTPAPIGGCRVLELGCAAGANLMPQALEFPESRFLGIDLSERQIADGQETVAALGLRNLELRQANILDINETWGQFDYILCHGVYSWVPPQVQGKILDVAQRNLAPQGVAIISYNTYPGWHFKGLIRELMLYHVGQFPDPQEQLPQSLALLEFLAEAVPERELLGKVVREELEALRKSNNLGYVFHEYLEECNLPIYFHQFMAEAAARGLQYLGEAEFDKMLLQNFAPKVQEHLGGLPLLQQEQYMDFVRGRKFRSTLLCHQGIPLNRQVDAQRMKQYHFALGSIPEVEQIDIRSEAPAVFRLKQGSITVQKPLVKVALMYLKEVFPRHVAFEQLYRISRERLARVRAVPGQLAETGEDGLATALLSGYTVSLFDMCRTPPRCVHQATTRPLATPLTRLQAASGDCVTNQRHQMIQVDEFQRQILRRLDGQHDRAALMSEMATAIASGVLVVRQRDQPVTHLDAATLGSLVDSALTRLSQCALLLP